MWPALLLFVQATPLVHPVWGSLPGSPHEERAARMFKETVGRHGFGPAETIDLPRPPASMAPARLRQGQAALEKLKFDEAQSVLDAAVTEVLATGGAGLEGGQLSDLFLAQ